MKIKIIILHNKISYETIKHQLLNILFLNKILLRYAFLYGFKQTKINGYIFGDFINPFLKTITIEETEY